MMDMSKFTSNKKILNGLVALSYNQVCCQTLFYKNIWTKKKKKKKIHEDRMPKMFARAASLANL